MSRSRGIARSLKWVGIAPGMSFLLMVFMVPVAFMLWESVSEPVLSFQHYERVLTDQTARIIMLRTLKVSITVATLAVVLSYPYAYLMTIVRARSRYILTLIVLIPFWSSLMARTFAWLVILQANGPLDYAARALGFGSVNILGSSAAVTIGMAQTLMPFAVFPLYATMINIDRTLLFAARSLGAPRYVSFFKIYLPLSEPGLVVGWFLVFVLSLGFYVTPQLLGSTHNALLSQYISIKISQQLQFGYGSALAVALLLITVLLLSLIGFVRHRAKLMAKAEVQI